MTFKRSINNKQQRAAITVASSIPSYQGFRHTKKNSHSTLVTQQPAAEFWPLHSKSASIKSTKTGKNYASSFMQEGSTLQDKHSAGLLTSAVGAAEDLALRLSNTV